MTHSGLDGTLAAHEYDCGPCSRACTGGADTSPARLLRAAPHHAPTVYEGARLTLVPSIFVWPRLIVGHETPGDFELTYAARGVGRLWEGVEPQERPEDQLGALLGRSRAAILALIEVPMSTTQRARKLGRSAGSVSQHLSILRASGLVVSWRSGRNVLYRRTPLAASLVAVNSGQPGQTDVIC